MTTPPIAIGARVRLIDAFPYPSGLTGTVFAKIDRYESDFPWLVDLDDGAGRTCLKAIECEVIDATAEQEAA